MKEAVPSIIQETDLRQITRCPELCLTVVYIQLVNWDRGSRVPWIRCGQASIRKPNSSDGSQYMLTAYLPAGVTDLEHDSAYAFGLPLIGVTLDGVDYSQTTIKAWVDPDPEALREFRVPRPGYNPMELPEAKICDARKHGYECYKNPHKVIPEGLYAGPKPDAELFEAVRGKKVEILFSPVYPKENE